MIIGFDGSRAFEKNKTGTENYSYQLLKNLLKFDTFNRYLVYFRPGNEVLEKNWPSNVKFKVLSFPRLWTQVGLALQTFKDPVDVLFVPGHTLPLIRRPKLKTVMTVHDLGVEYLPKTHQLKQRLYLGFITKFQFRSATRLVAVSKATQRDLIDKVGIDPKRIALVYEGLNPQLDISVKPDTKVDVLNRYDLESKKYFLFLGTIQPRKNLSRLIESYANFLAQDINHKKIKLVLGGGKGWLSDEIYELPKKLRIETQVKFLGRVPDSDLPDLYRQALALVFPSLYEGFGLPVLEAFACDCPVITSNSSSLPEVAGDAAILVDPYNIEAIALAMDEITEDKKLRTDLIRKGRAQLKKFSWQKAANETLEVLKEAASEK